MGTRTTQPTARIDDQELEGKKKKRDMGADASAEPALLQPRIVVFRALEKTCVLLRGGGDVFTIPGNVVASMAKVMGVCEDSSG
ncbi:unnamed protein product [Sphagnum balticum]